jgi:uncharacterized protein YgbK (DUF1537 family)
MVCAVIADDLTGACDSAVQFANVGLRTVVAFSLDAHADVVAFSTDTRNADPAEAAARLRMVSTIARARVIFKKIDSTLRGNTAVEIVAALDAFGCNVALVNPAYPAMGRLVERGWLYVTTDPSFEPVHLPTWLPDERCLCFDAFQQEDLDDHVRTVMKIGRRVLWVGSAGMAAALARYFARGGPGELPVEHPGPVLFCIGSNHPVTLEQERRVIEQRDAIVLRVERGFFEAPRVRPSALFLCGGDTAAVACRAFGVRSIELRRELAPGIPAGIVRGGLYDGLPVVTKSGGFGAPDDLILISDYFHA